MKFRTVLASLAAAATLAVALVIPASAGTTFAGYSMLPAAFTYDGSKLIVTAAGNNTVSSTTIFGGNDVGDTLSFSAGSLVNIGTLQASGFGSSQLLTGGSFSLKQGINTLLTGTFDLSVLQAIPNLNQKFASLGFVNVAFTGGSYWTTATSQVPPFFNPGDISISLLSTTAITSNGTNFDPFNASSSGTFSAENSPEPASVITFAFGAIGLVALVLRGRKSQRTMNLGA